MFSPGIAAMFYVAALLYLWGPAFTSQFFKKLQGIFLYFCALGVVYYLFLAEIDQNELCPRSFVKLEITFVFF